MMTRRMMLSLPCLLAVFCTFGSARAAPRPDGSYAIVVSEKTYADENWRKVVDVLRKKYKGTVISYGSDVQEAAGKLAARMPNYACFVARPSEAGRKFILAVHRMTRRLDSDPYTDVIWGVLTGYEAADALRIAKRTEPLSVRKMLGGIMINLDPFESGATFSEKKKGKMVVKLPGGKPENKTVPPDTTKAIVDWLNEKSPDVFLTSGHATERDWQIGYSYKNGQFRCKGGQLFGLDTRRKRFDINSPNPKVYLPLGNCLMGHVLDRESMALAWMHTGGVHQMVGYTVSTWFGGSGWGVRTLFIGQAGRFSLAEAFYLNNQALIHQLATRFPKSININFNRFGIVCLLGKLASRHSLRDRKELQLLWDRDTVAFYGDPAWEAKMPRRALAWSQDLSVKKNVYSFVVRTNTAGKWPGRPVLAMLPHRVRNIKVLEGADLSPVITDNFILLPVKGEFEKSKQLKVVFRADPAPRPEAKAIGQLKDARQAISLLPEEYRSSVTVALAKAGPNQGELIAAIRKTPVKHRKAIAFLIANMPTRDLKSLGQKLLLDNINCAYQARLKAPWSARIPEEVFMNYVLPYANLNERRDDWRRDFLDRFAAPAWKCETPTAAARMLNREVFKTLKVKYHATKRPKPDQSPYESKTAAGYASCTGLCVLLVDACRAVGIPARIVGAPLWVDKSGNHNWVEIWDGRWHHIGAASARDSLDDPNAAKKAATADPRRWQHCIYAASFRKTDVTFPLVWDSSIAYVPANDVTWFYTAPQKVKLDLPPDTRCDVTVRWNNEVIAEASGTRNVALTLAAGQKYDLEIRLASGKIKHTKLVIPKPGVRPRPKPDKSETNKATNKKPAGRPVRKSS